MNHLAHLFLSQRDINLMVGNFIADHIKANKIEPYSEEIRNGIMMHRAIDHFTDSHALVRQSKARLFPKYSHYASVLVDMFYDHILAKNWETYSPLSLESFAQSSYKVLKSKSHEMPERSVMVLDYMTRQDWLTNYGSINGMTKALTGIAKRAKFNSKMEEAATDLQRDFKLYEAEFIPFFKELFEYASQWKSVK